MKAFSPRRSRRRGNCIVFSPDAVLPLSLLDIRGAVCREVDRGSASAVLVILLNEFQDLLADDANAWRSRRYRRKDL